MLSPTPLVLTVLGAATSLAAQCPESAGPFAGTPGGVIVQGVAGRAPDQVYLRRAGFGAKLESWPAASLPASRPRFDLHSVLLACGATSTLDIDAISVGEDWVLGDCAGRAVVPAGRWAAVTFSVTPATTGAAGSRLATEVRSGSPGADIFSYVLPGSSIPPNLVGVVERALDAFEMGLGANADIRGFDLFLPYFTLENRIGNRVNEAIPGMMPAIPRVLFSLTRASASRAPTAWFIGGAPTPSGATILEITWGPNNVWSCPRVFMSYRDLSLASSEDIDGLAVDLDNQRMLFSTDISIQARDPLQYFTWAPGCRVAVPVPYTHPTTGQPISAAIGLRPGDDVDAICAMDPAAQRRGTGPGARPNAAFYVHGTPMPTLGVFPPPVLAASAFRRFDAGVLRFQTHCIGWPQGIRGPGFAGAMITPPGLLVPNAALGGVALNPASVFCGDPRTLSVVVPPLPALYGAQFYLRWFAVGAGPLAEAYPILITI